MITVEGATLGSRNPSATLIMIGWSAWKAGPCGARDPSGPVAGTTAGGGT
jgi:hypothetical protein